MTGGPLPMSHVVLMGFLACLWPTSPLLAQTTSSNPQQVFEAQQKCLIKLFGAGVDVITPDAALPLDEAGGAICEVNTTPGYYYHYKTAGEAVPVAEMVLRRLCDAAA